jgi:hypothetical protein
VGSTSCRNSGSCCRPDSRRPATAELGPAGGETRRGGLGARRAGSGLGGAYSPRCRGAGGGLDTARCASRSCPDVGCSHTGRASLAHLSGRPDVGCRTATSTASAGACAIVGRFAPGGSPRANMGLAGGRAEHCGAASRTIMGSTEARRGGTRIVTSSALMELARGPIMGRAAEHVEAP